METTCASRADSFTVTGVNGVLRPLRISRRSCRYGSATIFATRRSSPMRVARSAGRSFGQISSAVPATFVTRTRPFRSRIGPRGACTGNVRSWLFSAARRYCDPDSTCNAHRRRKRTPNTASASIPRIAIRSVTRGASLNGSSATAGVARTSGRLRVGAWTSDKEVHLLRALAAVERAYHAADERVHGQRQNQVEEDLRRQAIDEDDARRRVLPEHEVQRERADRVGDRDDADGDERCVRPVAPGRLAVAPDPVAGDREEKRRDAERVQVGRVDHEPRAESSDRAGDRPAQERDRDEGEQEQVRAPAEEGERGDDRDLDDRRDEQQHRRLRWLDRDHGSFGCGFLVTSTATASSEPKSTNGSTWICLKRSVSVWPTLVTRPIGRSAGYSEGNRDERVPAVTMTSPRCTSRSFVTRSSTSAFAEPAPCRMTPIAPVLRS